MQQMAMTADNMSVADPARIKNNRATCVTEPNTSWQRWVVLIVAPAAMALAIYCLPLIWSSSEDTLRVRLYDTISVSASIAMLAISALIAWRAGDSAANLAMALALTAACVSDTAVITLENLGLGRTLFGQTVDKLTYILGAGLFLRASQYFPRRLTADRVGNRVLAALLKPVALWPVAVVLSLIATSFPLAIYATVARLAIIGLGIIFFYKSYRTGDADARRKVLWFLAMAISAAAFTIVTWSVRLAIGDGAPETLRLVLGVSLASLNYLAILGCVAAAVFYAGAISPSLVIRKTVVYGLTTALLLFVFATVEVFLHHQIVHFLHVTDTFASSLIGGAFGLTFHPVKHFFEHLLKRYQSRHGDVPAGASPH
jgi:hypothetical protein